MRVLSQLPSRRLVCAVILCGAMAGCSQRPAVRQKLADAISSEDVAAFTAEIQKGFSPDQENSSDGKGGLTLIHTAANCNSTEFVHLLLDRGVKVDLRTAKRRNVANIAAAFGKADVARLLLDRGAQIDAGVESRPGAPLMAAAREGHLDVVKLLVERGAPVNHGQGYTTPLFLAGDGGHRDVVEYLISNGATSNMMITKAVEEKHPDLAKLMARADAVALASQRNKAIMAQVNEIERQAAALVKHSQDTGEPLDKAKLQQYRVRLAEIQQQLGK